MNSNLNRFGWDDDATMLLDVESELVYNHDKDLMALVAPDYVY